MFGVTFKGGEKMNELLNEIMPSIIATLAIILAYLATRIRNYFDEKITLDQQTQILRFVKATVEYVEQIGIDFSSEAKLSLAKATIVRYVNEKGIPITDNELNVLIESFVHSLTKPEVVIDEKV